MLRNMKVLLRNGQSSEILELLDVLDEEEVEKFDSRRSNSNKFLNQSQQKKGVNFSGR